MKKKKKGKGKKDRKRGGKKDRKKGKKDRKRKKKVGAKKDRKRKSKSDRKADKKRLNDAGGVGNTWKGFIVGVPVTIQDEEGNYLLGGEYSADGVSTILTSATMCETA